MSSCLSEFALDELMINDPGGTSGQAASHLQACDDCRQRYESRRAVLEHFEREQAPLFWHETRRGYLRRRNTRRAVVLGIPCGLAAACAFAFLARSGPSPAGSYLAAKGAAALEIHCRRAGRTFPLRLEDPVEPADELRFIPRPASSAVHFVQIASIDGSGRFTPFYPSSFAASSVSLPSPGQPLDGSIRLDSAPGPERLIFVFSPESLSVAQVEQAARQHLGDLRALSDIAGIAVESGWIVLDKTSAASVSP